MLLENMTEVIQRIHQIRCELKQIESKNISPRSRWARDYESDMKEFQHTLAQRFWSMCRFEDKLPTKQELEKLWSISL